MRPKSDEMKNKSKKKKNLENSSKGMTRKWDIENENEVKERNHETWGKLSGLCAVL